MQMVLGGIVARVRSCVQEPYQPQIRIRKSRNGISFAGGVTVALIELKELDGGQVDDRI